MPTTPDNDPAEFAARLNAAMDEACAPKRGRVAELARRFKVSQPTSSAWVNGRHLPEAVKARQMAADYGVKFEWLYMGLGPKNEDGSGGGEGTAPSSASEEADISPDAQRLIAVILKADRAQSVSPVAWRHLAGLVSELMAGTSPPAKVPTRFPA